MKSIVLLTDDELMSKASGEVKIGKDYNLKTGRPWIGGLYDKTIFGTTDRCTCGKVRTPGKYCPRCHEMVLSEADFAKRYGYYRLKVPYVAFYKIQALSKKLKSYGIVNSIKTVYDLWSVYFDFEEIGSEPQIPEGAGPEAWNDDLDNEKLLATSDGGVILRQGDTLFKLHVRELIDPKEDNGLVEVDRVGAFGLLKLREFTTESGEDFLWVEQFANTVVPINSPAFRPLTFFRMGGSQKITVPDMTHNFEAIIYYNEVIDDYLNGMYHTMVDEATLCCMMNELVNRTMESNDILQPSKESLIRNLVETRVGRSGRANIVSRPDLPIDVVALPRSLVYYAIQSDIIEYLNGSDDKNKYRSYLNATPEAIKAMEDIIGNSKAILCRNPSLHKFSMMAFNIELWDEISIGLPNLVCEAFNADFDGDQMFFQIITDPAMVASLESMSPRNLWLYEKYEKSLYVPKHETLFGLHVATQIKSVDKMKIYNNFNEIEKEYKDGHISIDQQLILNDRVTTYGREKIYQIVGHEIPDILGTDGICDNNIGIIVSMIGGTEDRTRRLLELQNFGDETATLEGVGTVPFFKIYKTNPEKVKEILSADEPLDVKVQDLKDYTAQTMKEVIKNLPDSNVEQLLKGSGRVKISSMVDMYAPTIRTDGTLRYDSSTIFSGLNERSYAELANYDRQMLQMKMELTPVSGYDQRQLVNSEMHLIYDADAKSTDEEGIILNRKDAIGRVDLNGILITGEGDPEEKIRVKSCVNTDTNIVCSDEIAHQKFTSVQNGATIGISFASSLMEQVTQGALGLKHGGTLSFIENEVIKSVEPGEVKSITDDFIEIVGNHTYKYRLSKITIIDYRIHIGSKVTKDQVIARSNRTLKVDNNLSRFNTLVDANVAGDLGIKTGSCISYATTDGIIHYYGDDVAVGADYVGYSENELYYYPDGYKVKKGQRICTGVLDPNAYLTISGDIGWTYYCFYDNIKSIFGFINSELVETLFKSIRYDGFSVDRKNNNNTNFIDRLYFGSTTKAVKDAIERAALEADGDKVGIALGQTVLLPILGFRNE